MRQQKFEACQQNLQEFEACRQKLAAALQQNEDSERVLQQVVSKLNENAQNMAGKDERCVLLSSVCILFRFLKLFISLEKLKLMLRDSQEELADLQVEIVSHYFHRFHN